MSVSEEELEQLAKTRAALNVDDEFSDVEDDTDDELEDMQETLELLKNTAVLLEFIASPDLCKSITQSLRTTINRVVEKIDKRVDALSEHIEALREDDE